MEIVAFSNKNRKDLRLLKKFVAFHWEHYRNEPQYVPLLDYEYLGSKLVGFKGFFEPDNLFFKHAEIKFFMALRQNEIVGRCTAFVNHDHNKHWKDSVGFFGQFEAIDDDEVADALLQTAGTWLKARNMKIIRGPQNLPVNEATPGFLTDGFDSRPVIYYHYNKPYYADLVKRLGFRPVKKVFSWEYTEAKPYDERFVWLVKKVIERFQVKIEAWGDRSFEERRREMLEVYNEAWNDNWGFVPFRREELYRVIKEMQMVIDKDLFGFLYIHGELAGFFGALPNILERMVPIRGFRKYELLRAAKMLFTLRRIKGVRLGYLGVKKKFRRLGLEGVMLWMKRDVGIAKGYEYLDVGWVLEDNQTLIKVIEKMEGNLSKTYTIFEKPMA
jgi:hypothetical protein